MKSIADLIRDFRQATHGVEKIKNDAPRIFGVIAVKNIHNNFLWQGYNDGLSFRSWQHRKAKTDIAYSANRGKGGTSQYKGSVFNAANPILQQTRSLYNAVQYQILTGGRVFVGVNLDVVPYAIAHNEGLNHQPQRQYMPIGGANYGMIKEFSEKVTTLADKAMVNFKR